MIQVTINRVDPPVFTGFEALCWMVEVEGYRDGVYHSQLPDYQQVISDVKWITREGENGKESR